MTLKHATKSTTASLTLGTIGVVFGDIGTSPLYAIKEIFETGELKVDLSKRQVFVSQKEIKITPTEYHILFILIQHAGLVVTYKHLLKNVWGMQHLDNQHYLRIYMRRLRHKIEENPTQPRYLLTETGVGYRLLNNTI